MLHVYKLLTMPQVIYKKYVVMIIFYLIFCCQIYCSLSLENKLPSQKQFQAYLDKEIEAALEEDYKSGETLKVIHTVIHGQNSAIEKYPWLIQLLNDNKSHCGGVIISRRIILTSCHCVTTRPPLQLADPTTYTVLVGSSLELEGYEYKPCKFRCHPKYRTQGFPYYYYDLALILLQTNIIWSHKVQPATFAPSNVWKHPQQRLTVAGFGSLTDDKYDLSYPITLQDTTMILVDQKTCSQSETFDKKSPMPVPSHMFCMIGYGGWPTSDCYGDSGSGVMWGMYVVGIVTTGRTVACGSTTVPSMYIDVTHFKTWISKKGAKLETRTMTICQKP